MTEEARVTRGPRRTAAEVEQIVNEFETSGLNRSQFCQRNNLALITLNRYLKRVRGESTGGATTGRLIAVELDSRKQPSSGALVVVLSSSRRIEVGAQFDDAALRRLVHALETM